MKSEEWDKRSFFMYLDLFWWVAECCGHELAEKKKQQKTDGCLEVQVKLKTTITNSDGTSGDIYFCMFLL